MNINSLLEALYNTELKTRDYSGVGTDYRRRLGGGTKTKTIGVGTRSNVADDKTDPHLVRKYNPSAVPENGADGFGKFFEWVANNKIENRYLPRVYKVQKNRNPKTGYVAYSYRMEKLIPLRQLNAEEMIALLSNCIDLNGIYHRYISHEDDNEVTQDVLIREYELLMYYSLKYVDSYVVGHISEHSLITDEELLKAIEILQKYVKDNFNGNYNAAGSDLHDGNFMARRTQHGLQLVISDPFW